MKKDMCRDDDQTKKFKMKKLVFGPIFAIAGITALGYLVMCLWNALLPEILGVKVITYWQAVGIFILSKLLFGGFHPGGGHRHHHRHHRHFCDKNDPRMNLSPEEREKMRRDWWESFGRDKESGKE